MVTDAETHSDEDKVRRQKVEARNRLDHLIYTTESTFDEHKDKLPAEEKGNLEKALADAKQAQESDDLSVLEQALNDLTQASHKLAEVMYQSTGTDDSQGGAGAAPGPDAATDDGEVIDAEYVDVEDKG